jgi:cytochrome c oxidase subunit 1
LLLIFDKFNFVFLSDIYIAGEVLHYQGGSHCLSIYFGFRSLEVYIVLLPALGIPLR